MPKVRVSEGTMCERHEKKYRLSEEKYLLLTERLMQSGFAMLCGAMALYLMEKLKRYL